MNTSVYQVQLQRAILKVKSIGRNLLPGKIWGIDPKTNYIDYNLCLRKRDDLKKIVYENIQDLKQRGVIDWLNVDKLWKLHQQNRGNFSDALTLLTMLELNLKAGILEAN
jgi:hypothetical protein